MGSIHHLSRYLAQITSTLRPLLKTTEKNKPNDCKPEHKTSIKNIIKSVSETTQNNHFDQNLETRIVTDASLEQHSQEGWVVIAYVSRFLYSLEEKHSVNKHELLKVVWAIEHFKYHLYVKYFTVITDHQASIGALKANERSKTSESRITRWIDRLILFHFDIKHLAGNKMGLRNYMSQNLTGLVIPPSEYDEEFVVASINALISDLEVINNFIFNK